MRLLITRAYQVFHYLASPRNCPINEMVFFCLSLKFAGFVRWSSDITLPASFGFELKLFNYNPGDNILRNFNV